MPTAAKRKPSRPRTPPPVRFATAADLMERLGGIPPERVLFDPLPGTATEADLVWRHDRKEPGLLELIDGTLVRKPMGSPESYIASRLNARLDLFLETHDLGFLYTTDALIRVHPGQVRGPDVSFTGWAKRPDKTVPREPVTDIVPDLAVEILSPGNTPKEIARKIGEYFAGGCRLVWVIDPDTEAAEAYTSPTDRTAVPPAGALDGGDVLPGFRLPLAKLFERLAKPAPQKKPPAKKPPRKKK
ncbi:MAG: Uma2 family endonuclease [Gemmataceae bacterium]